MWVHGGFTAAEGPNSAVSEVWSIDLEARPLVWSELPASGSLLARAGHSAVVTNGALWFFGGATAYWERHDVMSCIDLEAVPPRQGILSMPEGPGARWQHESVVTSGLLVVFGGWVNERENDLWTFNMTSSSCTWATQERPEMWTRTSLVPRPSSRNAHSAALGPNASMWIFGGWDGNTVGDLWSLGLEDSPMEWMQASVSSPGSFYNPVTVVTENLLWLFGGYGDGPHCGGWSNQLYSIDLSASSLAWTDHGGYGYPRNKHSGIVTSTGVMWVFGGNLCREYYSTDDVGHFISIDLRAQVISYTSHSSYNEPSWRKEHSAVVTAAGVMWLFGGDDESTRLSDLYSIDLNASPMVWAQYVLVGPAPRSGHSAALRGGEMWIFGGQANDGSYYNVPWFIDVEATTLTWVEVLSSGSDVPMGRHRASTVIAAGVLWVLGGWGSGGLSQDDLWSMQTQSTTTSTTSSSSSTTSTHYVPCPAGSYKMISDAPCEPCPIGKFNSEAGALSPDACQDCPVGSITKDEGANHLDLCVRPLDTHSLECVSGQVCAVSLNGFSLQAGHQLAMLSSGCTATALQVPNVPDSGVSKPATQEGRFYVWGENSGADFTPEGGYYSLCWCPNMHDRMCAELQDFQFPAGQLKVSGPLSNHFFQCARGQDCKALGPVQGVDLSTQDQVSIRSDGCGSAGSAGRAIAVSPANKDGMAHLEVVDEPFAGLALSFGISRLQEGIDHRLFLDADVVGYDLCWCGLDSCLLEDYVVPLGSLQVDGPRANQEVSCSVGQLCSLRDIQSVRAHAGDRVMVLTACGTGYPVPGFPGSGIAELNTDDSDDAFFELLDATNTSQILQSPAGIFRLCFCRPKAEPDSEACETPSGFAAPVGLMVVQGPFDQSTACNAGQLCALSLAGMALTDQDKLLLTPHACDSPEVSLAVGLPGYDALQQPVSLEEVGRRLQASLGKLPLEIRPGVYHACWCGAGSACTSLSSFRAAAGTLSVNCPGGYFYASEQSPCRLCGRGFYCPGGSRSVAARVPCPDGETTLSANSSSRGDCVCARGHQFSSGTCVVCKRGFYKADEGSSACSSCPANFTTYLVGSISNSSCVTVEALSAEVAAGNDTVSSIATVAFELSLRIVSGDVSDLSDSEMRMQLISTLRRSISTSTRMPAAAIDITLAASAARRLSQISFVSVALKYPSQLLASESAEELEVDTILDGVGVDLQSNLGLAGLAFEVEAISQLTVSSLIVTCPPNEVKPPGAVVLQPSDCICRPGYGYDASFQRLEGACIPCALGEYKLTVGDSACVKCDPLKSTLLPGASSPNQCRCQAGLYDEAGQCRPCEVGSFCDGSGVAKVCNANSTTTAGGSRSSQDCICELGHQYKASDESCEPCPRAFYKANLGNAFCSSKCPANADSKPSASSLADCFCMADHHAILDGSGNLDRCASCGFYAGLECPGGFEQGLHAQPRAEEGFFRTGLTNAVRCLARQANGSSVCRGGVRGGSTSGAFSNECAEGSAGHLCGECPESFARGRYLEPCEPCFGHSSALLGLSMLAELARMTVLNFGMAWISARAAGTTLALHSIMIRLVLHWRHSCSILEEFELQHLVAFPWSQRPANDLSDCAGGQCQLNFPFPPEVADLMSGLFSLMNIIPSVNVEYAMACEADAWFPGNAGAKRLVPAVYHLCLPLLSAMATLLFCAALAYIVVPVGSKCGVFFNDAARKRQRCRSLAERLATAIKAEASVGHSRLSDYMRSISAEALEEEFWDVPYEVVARSSTDSQLQAAANGNLSDQVLQRLVLGSLAWKLRGHFEEEAKMQGLPVIDVAAAVANGTTQSSSQLRATLEDAEACSALMRGVCQELKREPTPSKDATELDFAFFTQRPGPFQLLHQSMPAIWLTQMVLWPSLLSKLLQHIRCSPMVEERAGEVVYVQRLLPHPDVVCWQADHRALAALAVAGLGFWCIGLPFWLFLKIWRLQDRQDPNSYRKYGFFFQGLEPQYWYWDLIVKRVDLLLMLLVANTSLADDDNAKLVLFPLISGLLLGVTTWLKPYTNSQSEILDLMEFILLTTRFVLFSTLASLLIFFPSAEVCWIWAVSLLVMLVLTVVYSSLHIMAQVVRNAASQILSQEHKVEHVQEEFQLRSAFRPNVFDRVVGAAQKLRETLLLFILPFFQPNERLLYIWSLYMQRPKVITTGGELSLRYSCLAKLLRLDLATQQDAVRKSYHEFVDTWGSHFEGQEVLNFDILCALAASARTLPATISNSKLGGFWMKELKGLSSKGAEEWRLSVDDLQNTVHRFGALPGNSAHELMSYAQDLLETALQVQLDKDFCSADDLSPLHEGSEDPGASKSSKPPPEDPECAESVSMVVKLPSEESLVEM
ncbi:rngB [Symbiodinium sp. CCMP2592]|nr:rngB [Symbiodinium sp. CCMP2592]